MSGTGWEIVESGGGDSAPDSLERRYRRLLAILPNHYRVARGEEMLGALMDGAPEGRRWPKVGEALSLAMLGIRVRSGVRGEGPTAESAGSAVLLARAVGLAGSLLFTFLTVRVAFGVTWQWSFYTSDINFSDLDGHRHSFAEAVVLHATGLIWFVAFVALVLGLRRTARATGVVLGVVAVLQISGLYTLLAALPPLVTALGIGVAASRGLTRAPRPGLWFSVLIPVAGLCLFFQWSFTRQSWNSAFRAVSPLMLESAVAVAGVVAVAVAVATVRTPRSPAWPLAFAVVGAMAVGQYLLEQNHYPFPEFVNPTLTVLLFFEGVLVSVAGYAVLRRRRDVARGIVAGRTA